MTINTIPTKDDIDIFNLLNNIVNNIDSSNSNKGMKGNNIQTGEYKEVIGEKEAQQYECKDISKEVGECRDSSREKEVQQYECKDIMREKEAQQYECKDIMREKEVQQYECKDISKEVGECRDSSREHEAEQGGYVDNFVDIVDNSVDKVIRTLTMKYSTTMEALDVQASINLGLYKAYKTYKEGNNFAKYFYTVARNEILMEYRRQQRRACMSYDVDEVFQVVQFEYNPKHNVDMIYDIQECFNLAKAFTKKCSKQVQDVIGLLFEGYSPKQVSDKLGVAKSSVSRCKKIFRDKFYEAYPEYINFLREI